MDDRSVRKRQGVTVVVPTLNRDQFLPRCLRCLVGQRHRPLQILVVDQSTEANGDVVRLAAQHRDLVDLHRVSFRGLPMARNYGWQYAKHEAIVFVDDDIECGPELVSEHLIALSSAGVGLVAGGIDSPAGPVDRRPRPGTFCRWTATPQRGFAAEGSGEADHAAGCNFSAWRVAIEEAGGVDEGLSVGAALYEETDLCLRVKRAGYRVVFHGPARLTHLAVADGGCRVERVPDYVRALAHNRGMMIRRHCRWYHAPVALGRLTTLGLSYARHYRAPETLSACLWGTLQGLRAGGRAPACTAFRRGYVA